MAIMVTCSVETCDKKKYCKSYCTMHYQRFNKYGDPLAEAPSLAKTTSITEEQCCAKDCTRIIKCRGMCKLHYEKFLEDTPREVRSPRLLQQELLENLSREYLLEVIKANNGISERIQSELDVSKEAWKTFRRNNVWEFEACQSTRESYFSADRVAERDLQAKINWKNRNREKVREINRRWAKNQDPANRARWNNYNRERRKNLEAYIMDAETLEYVKVLYEDPCIVCGTRDRITVDHIIAVENGGTSHWSNLAAMCWSHNSSKGDRRELFQFLLYLNPEFVN